MFSLYYYVCEGTVCLGQPNFSDACTLGLRWLVLAADCAIAWPTLPDLCQKALNTDSRQAQSEVEVMLDMQGLWQHAIISKVEPDWQSIMAAACSQSPPCASYIDALATYVQKQAPELLQELSIVAKTCEPEQKDIAIRPHCGSEFWQKLNSLSWGKVDKYPHVLHAAVCANLVSPKSKVVDGHCRLIPPGSLSLLSSKPKVQMVKDAEAFLATIRQAVTSLGLDRLAAAPAIGRATCRVLYFLVGKGKESAEGKVYKSMEEITKVPQSSNI